MLHNSKPAEYKFTPTKERLSISHLPILKSIAAGGETAFLGYTIYSHSTLPSLSFYGLPSSEILEVLHTYFSNIFDNGLLIVFRMAKWNRSGNGLLEDFKQLL